MTRLLTSIAALAAAGALIAGCGSDDDSSSGSSAGGGGGYGSETPAKTTAKTTTDAAAAPAASSGEKLAIKAVESNGLSFDPKTLKAKAGTVTITMDNPSADSQPHAVSVEGTGASDASSEVVQPGNSSAVTLKVKPGKYTFYCPVGSHRAAGMEGTLTVR
jgi:plastocyanin